MVVEMTEGEEDAARFKEEGNAHYKARRFNEAVECYTKAHAADPTSPVCVRVCVCVRVSVRVCACVCVRVCV